MPQDKSTEQLWDQAREAPEREKVSLLRDYCQAAIYEFEQGKTNLYRVGGSVTYLINEISLPPVSLHTELSSVERIIEQLFSVAGRLDMAAQGGTSNEEDGRLWQEFKDIVDRLDLELNQK